MDEKKIFYAGFPDPSKTPSPLDTCQYTCIHAANPVEIFERGASLLPRVTAFGGKSWGATTKGGKLIDQVGRCSGMRAGRVDSHLNHGLMTSIKFNLLLNL